MAVGKERLCTVYGGVLFKFLRSLKMMLENVFGDRSLYRTFQHAINITTSCQKWVWEKRGAHQLVIVHGET